VDVLFTCTDDMYCWLYDCVNVSYTVIFLLFVCLWQVPHPIVLWLSRIYGMYICMYVCVCVPTALFTWNIAIVCLLRMNRIRINTFSCTIFGMKIWHLAEVGSGQWGLHLTSFLFKVSFPIIPCLQSVSSTGIYLHWQGWNWKELETCSESDLT
jgi:hypothetical protein